MQERDPSATDGAELTLGEVRDVLASWQGRIVHVHIKGSEAIVLALLNGTLSEERTSVPGFVSYAVGGEETGDVAFIIREASFYGAKLEEGSDAVIMQVGGGYIEVEPGELPGPLSPGANRAYIAQKAGDVVSFAQQVEERSAEGSVKELRRACVHCMSALNEVFESIERLEELEGGTA